MTDPSVHNGQDNATDTQSPSPLLVFAFVALMFVLAGSLLALYALTPDAGKPALLDTFKGWAPTGVIGIPAIAAAFGLHFARTKQLQSVARDTAQIKRQTNGVLDDRISAAVSSELDARALGFPPVAAGVIRDPEPGLPPLPAVPFTPVPGFLPATAGLGMGAPTVTSAPFQGRGGG